VEQSCLQSKERILEEALKGLGSVIVAYSGGVDSSLLAYYAKKVLGHRARIVIAVSPSLAQEELDAARLQAEQFDWDLLEVQTNEVDQEQYQRNDLMRCYFCKTALFEELELVAEREGITNIAYGANLDDRADFRPGQKAAREHKVVSPLQDAQLTKEDIRALARQSGLPSWDRPQAACLSSRFPTFERVTIEGLSQVEKAEHYLHSLGFKQLRVRHHGDIARLELSTDELFRLSGDADLMQQVSDRLKEFGYRYVTLDMEGYRQGSSNRVPPNPEPTDLPFADLGFAKPDIDRKARQGVPEVILCTGKSPEQIVKIAQELRRHHPTIIATRATAECAESILPICPDAQYFADARVIVWGTLPKPDSANRQYVAVVCAGTGDVPVAEEACITLTASGINVRRIYDVGVAGVHRLMANMEPIAQADAVIVIAGMDGALPSVVGGLVACPVIAVPTSIGYGASFQGLAALLTMLNSCAAGLTVVNIDNGFGAAMAAIRLFRRSPIPR
jgi:pyridinium-3,5-biscarboxylic acid mononucleotide sulfurtransferase